MKQLKILKPITIILLGVAWSGVVSAAATGVVGSKHDLTTAGGAQQTTGNTDQVCVFCHTPHASATGASVPLWNKVLPDPASFTQYGTLNTPTFDSTEAPVGSVSLACLSCHDGVQAMDLVVNVPGPGQVDRVNGIEIDTGAIGAMTGTPVPVLGVDLTDDHPISMQYGGGGPAAGDTPGQFPGTLGDPDFELPFLATVNGNPVWWVDSPAGTAGQREKTDMILYARNLGGTVQPLVECGSCHDPHNQASGAVASSVQFMRINNTASQICTSCHVK